jgi:predicted DNA-binding transcriptional regulator AlpA
MEKERLCIGELAQHLDVDRATVYRWMGSGNIPKSIIHHDLNRRVFFLRTEIDLYRDKFDRMQQSAT